METIVNKITNNLQINANHAWIEDWIEQVNELKNNTIAISLSRTNSFMLI